MLLTFLSRAKTRIFEMKARIIGNDVFLFISLDEIMFPVTRAISKQT